MGTPKFWTVAAVAIVVGLVVGVYLRDFTGSIEQKCERGSWVVYQGDRAVGVDGPC